jgi:triosephosphate isomerase
MTERTLAQEIADYREDADGRIAFYQPKRVTKIIDALEYKLVLARKAIALSGVALEPIIGAGTKEYHSPAVQNAIHDAIRHIRIALTESSLDEPLQN